MKQNKKSGNPSKLAEKTGDELPASPPTLPATSLRLLVFVAGAVVMGLEIAGSRILAPFFGNSVFIWGSLISVFLAALTLGYYGGGTLADAKPSGGLLSVICMAVSVWMLGIAIFAHRFCGLIADAGFGERTGPLAAALALFLLPSIGMGIVSPFAIRLMAKSVDTLGKTSGSLYALSTLGSIAGTMATTFLLVPSFGVSTILKILAGALFVAALIEAVGSGEWASQRRRAIGAAIIVVGFCWARPSRVELAPAETLVADLDTAYHHISVIDDAVHDARELRFDRFVESAIRRSKPHRSLSNYTDAFHLAFLYKPQLADVVFIGAGGGIGPREFHVHRPETNIDVVDIDPKVLEVAKRHFFMPDSPRLRTFSEDGRMFLRRASRKYDCIVLDAFTIGGRIPFHLATREFFELCRDRLADDGVFVMNINSALDGPMAGIYRSMLRSLADAFPRTYAFAKDHRALGRNQSMNVILVGTRGGELAEREWVERAGRHYSASNVGPRELEAVARGLVAPPPDLANAPLFTDDRSAIETLAF